MTVKELKDALWEAADDDQVLFCIPGTQGYAQAEIVMTCTQKASILLTSCLSTDRQQMAVDWKAAYFGR